MNKSSGFIRCIRNIVINTKKLKNFYKITSSEFPTDTHFNRIHVSLKTTIANEADVHLSSSLSGNMPPRPPDLLLFRNNSTGNCWVEQKRRMSSIYNRHHLDCE